MRMLTVKEAAKVLGVTPGRVWQYVRQGRLSVRRVAVIREEDLKKLVVQPVGRPRKGGRAK